jgi:glucose-1-phosphate thymidylyltransferase
MEAGVACAEPVARVRLARYQTHDSLLETSEFVRTLQKRQGVHIASLEEIAFVNGLIDVEQLKARGKLFGKTTYGRYLMELAEHGVPKGHYAAHPDHITAA